jgi:hypothetical protein
MASCSRPWNGKASAFGTSSAAVAVVLMTVLSLAAPTATTRPTEGCGEQKRAEKPDDHVVHQGRREMSLPSSALRLALPWHNRGNS